LLEGCYVIGYLQRTIWFGEELFHLIIICMQVDVGWRKTLIIHFWVVHFFGSIWSSIRQWLCIHSTHPLHFSTCHSILKFRKISKNVRSFFKWFGYLVFELFGRKKIIVFFSIRSFDTPLNRQSEVIIFLVVENEKKIKT